MASAAMPTCFDFSPLLAKKLEAHLKNGLVLTTSYSGAGCAETVIPMIADPVPEAKTVAYAASEIKEEAREMLLNHHTLSAPRHVFGDVLELLPEDVRAELQGVQDRALELAKAAYHQKDSHETERNSNKFLEGHVAWPQEGEGLSNSRRWCFRCKAYCSCSPRDEGERGLWIEAAGTPCISWSSMRNRATTPWADWMHPATFACLTWLCWVGSLSPGPDILIHECVAQFDVAILRAVLEPAWHIESWVVHTQEHGHSCKKKAP